MSGHCSNSCTAFAGHRLLLSGSLVEVARAVKRAIDEGATDPILVFDDEIGRVIDLDLRGSEAEVVEKLSLSLRPPTACVGALGTNETATTSEHPEPRGRGRPKLGVVAREVTLLPRHWDWLATQPGGASAILRRLVDNAKRNGNRQQERRQAQAAVAYHFMTGIAGDLPGYEEAIRALFANDRAGLERQIAGWSGDIQTHVLRLSFGPSDPNENKRQL